MKTSRKQQVIPRSCNERTAGFTLMELLVVAAILTVLAALLFSSLGQTRQAARRIQCVGNLRQLGLAAQMYWDEHEGRAFRWRGAATNAGHIYWFGWLGNGPEGTREFDVKQGALYPYLGSRGVEVCPSFAAIRREVKLKATGASYGYGYNLELSTPESQPPLNMAKVMRPAETGLLADCGQVNTFQAPASRERPMLEEFYYFNTREATVHFRHRARANVVFCDGHVDFEKPVAGSLDARLRGQSIGRIRGEKVMVQEQ